MADALIDQMHTVACGQCVAEFAVGAGSTRAACPRCGAVHLVRILATRRCNVTLAQAVADEVDEMAAQRRLDASELQVRTLLLAIEENLAAAQEIQRAAEQEVAAVRTHESSQTWGSLALLAVLAALAIGAAFAGGALRCLALPIAAVAVYWQWQAYKTWRAQRQQAQQAVEAIAAQAISQVEVIEGRVAALERQLADGPRC